MKLARLNLFNLPNPLKNLKRIVLVITLDFFASKVLSSGFQLIKSENKAAAIVNK